MDNTISKTLLRRYAFVETPEGGSAGDVVMPMRDAKRFYEAAKQTHALESALQEAREDKCCDRCAVLPIYADNKRPTFVYLGDGTKVVVRSNDGAAWLEVVPQAKVSAAETNGE